jgi:DNA segregation ATPase FtsK/SpoIIIE, S-DNA-T family
MPAPRPSSYQPDDSEPSLSWTDRLLRLEPSFGRYSRDIGGVLLLALALMLLLALFGLTDGVLLGAAADLLLTWLGLGSVIVVTLLTWGGLALLWKGRLSSRPGLIRVLAMEGAAFLLLALFAYLGSWLAGMSGDYRTALERAEAGLDGGRIGWAISSLLGQFVGPAGGLILVLLGLAICLVIGFGLVTNIESWLFRMGGQSVPAMPGITAAPVMDGPPAAWGPSAQPPAPSLEESVAAPAEKPKKKPVTLPPEFRKSLKVPDAKDERPATPRQRGERLPPLNMLLGDQSVRPDEKTINQTAGLIEKTLSEFGIPATVVGFRVGPTVTQFAVQPGFIKKPGSNEDDPQLMKVRVAQISALNRDLALALSAERLRIEAPVPGKSYVGIEVPNTRTSIVRMRPILESETFAKSSAPLAMALGRDVSGTPIVADLTRMPHLLIAGATGSGKSVCITAIAACLAMNNAPEDLRMVMIDSKMVELIRFNGLRHLYGKVETDIQRILGVLRWVTVEMDHRYRLLESIRARDIDAYNRRVRSRKGELQPLPRIVVFIDELADLMMSAPDQTEYNLVRLAQMARATGIHLVVATQRPSTDVVTGLIKANFPARLAFAVASGVDSRVILDTQGADSLLGRGDMLFLQPEVGAPVRAQGVLITDQEIERIIAFWQKMSPAAEQAPPWESLLMEASENGDDALMEQAVLIVRQSQKASASLLQRRLRIGYPRAARLLDQLEEMGVVGPSQGGGRDREVLAEPLGADEPEDGGA